MNNPINSREGVVETQTRETGDHFHGHRLPWEMDKVSTLGDWTIVLWASDRGEIPHFHVIRGEDLLMPEVEACLKIQSAEYYPHGGRPEARLPDSLLGKLVERPESKDRYAVGTQTVWQSLVGDWNRNNKVRKVPLTTAMPDYRNLSVHSAGAP